MTIISGCMYFKRNQTSGVEICVTSKEVNIENYLDAVRVNDTQRVCGFCEMYLGKI